MIGLIKNVIRTLRYNKKGGMGGWIIAALIIAAAIIIAVVIYTKNQTHPFWEVE